MTAVLARGRAGLMLALQAGLAPGRPGSWRTAVADLLRATGVEYAEAIRQVRDAIGWRGRPHGARKRHGRSV